MLPIESLHSNGFRILVGVFSLLLVGPVVCGQESNRGVAIRESSDLDRWIEQLASDRYEDREYAMGQLVEAGESALEKLKAALARCEHMEQKIRLQALILRVEDTIHRHRLEAFVRDTDPENDYGMKAWPKFRDLVGNNRTCRKIFVEIYQAQPELADMIANNPEGLVIASGLKALEIRDRHFSGQTLAVGDGLALLFAGITSPQPLGNDTVSMITRCLHFNPLSERLARFPQWRKQVDRMLDHFILKISSVSAYDAVELAISYKLPNGPELARRVLGEPKTDVEVQSRALYLLGQLGTRSDLPFLQTYLDNGTDWTPAMQLTYQNEANQIVSSPFQSKLQDIALASSILLANQRLGDYFVQFDKYQGRVNALRAETIAFPIDVPERRREALERWRKFYATLDVK